MTVTCSISRGKSKVMSTPASGCPSRSPLTCDTSGSSTFPPSQSAPSSSGVTATGENAVAGFDW